MSRRRRQSQCSSPRGGSPIHETKRRFKYEHWRARLSHKKCESLTTVSFLPRMAGRSPPRFDTAVLTSHGACTNLQINLKRLFLNSSVPSTNRCETRGRDSHISAHKANHRQIAVHLEQTVEYRIGTIRPNEQVDNTMGGRAGQQPTHDRKEVRAVRGQILSKLRHSGRSVMQWFVCLVTIDTNSSERRWPRGRLHRVLQI